MEESGPTTGSISRAALLVVAVVAGALALAPAPASASKLRSFELPSRLIDTTTPGGKLGDGREVPKVNVLLPGGYKAKAKRRYPVLWLLHGAAGGTDNWLPGIKKLAADFKGIVVMPDGGRFGMYINWWNGGSRGDPAWANYHLKHLRKTIERRYRIRRGRRWHAIGGISMGGQGALRYAAMLPGYFGSAFGLSAAVPDMQSEIAQLGMIAVLPAASGGDQVTYKAMFGSPASPYAEGNSPQTLVPNYSHTRMYLTSGNGVNCPQDPVNPQSIAIDTATETSVNAEQAPFAAAARAEGAVVNEVTTCGVHTFGVWDRGFAAVRKWGMFKQVRERPRRWAYRTIARTGNMWGLRFRFAEPPTKVAEFKRAGRRLKAQGSGRVQIHGPRGCHVSGKLPFEQRLPRACRD